MVRTQIQLPETKYQRLCEASHRLNRSMAACIREGIDLFLGKTGPDDLSDVAGKFRPLRDREEDSRDARWSKAILASKSKARS